MFIMCGCCNMVGGCMKGIGPSIGIDAAIGGGMGGCIACIGGCIACCGGCIACIGGGGGCCIVARLAACRCCFRMILWQAAQPFVQCSIVGPLRVIVLSVHCFRFVQRGHAPASVQTSSRSAFSSVPSPFPGTGNGPYLIHSGCSGLLSGEMHHRVAAGADGDALPEVAIVSIVYAMQHKTARGT